MVGAGAEDRVKVEGVYAQGADVFELFLNAFYIATEKVDALSVFAFFDHADDGRFVPVFVKIRASSVRGIFDSAANKIAVDHDLHAHRIAHPRRGHECGIVYRDLERRRLAYVIGAYFADGLSAVHLSFGCFANEVIPQKALCAYVYIRFIRNARNMAHGDEVFSLIAPDAYIGFFKIALDL